MCLLPTSIFFWNEIQSKQRIVSLIQPWGLQDPKCFLAIMVKLGRFFDVVFYVGCSRQAQYETLLDRLCLLGKMQALWYVQGLIYFNDRFARNVELPPKWFRRTFKAGDWIKVANPMQGIFHLCSVFSISDQHAMKSMPKGSNFPRKKKCGLDRSQTTGLSHSTV